jgi:nicotinamidase-related amidase
MSIKKNSKTALLVMDIQSTIISYLPDPAPLLSNIEKAAKAAHLAGIKVIYVTLGFREEHPEIHHEHHLFGVVKANNMFIDSHEGTAIHPDITLRSSDIIVVKKRVSAFAGSDLDIILRAHKTESLALAGVSTSGVVLSTLREAADKDYHMTVLSDACADPNIEVHEFLVKNIFPFSGDIATTDQWIESIG